MLSRLSPRTLTLTPTRTWVTATLGAAAAAQQRMAPSVVSWQGAVGTRMSSSVTSPRGCVSSTAMHQPQPRTLSLPRDALRLRRQPLGACSSAVPRLSQHRSISQGEGKDGDSDAAAAAKNAAYDPKWPPESPPESPPEWPEEWPAPRQRLALLYVPGSSQKMVDKAASSQADTIIFDLEDSVAPEAKEEARRIVAKALQGPCGQAQEKAVRINSVLGARKESEKDLQAILPCPGLDTIVIPKVEWLFDICEVSQKALDLRPKHLPRLQIILSVESPGSLMRMDSLLRNFYEADGKPFIGEVYPLFHEEGIAALLFASEDYCAASGIQRSRSRKELLFPRAHMATIAKAHGLAAIDMVCIDYKDEEYLREESLEGRSIGMDGKQAIHPSQVKAIQKAFLPSEEDIERATRIQEAYESSIAAGAGAVGLKEKDGSTIMIDTPMLLQARTTLRKARAAGLDVPDPDA